MQTDERPLVSIIVPVYNREKMVSRALDSLVAQSYRPLEIVLIDDGSSDNTYQVLNRWAEGHVKSNLTVIVLKQDNLGAPSARNLGIQNASGRYLQFLDSDDTLAPPKIAMQVAELESSHCDVAVCDFRCIFEFEALPTEKVVLNDGSLLCRMARGWSIYTSTPLIRANFLKVRIQWDEKLRRFQDVDFLFRVMILANSYIYTPGVWCNYFLHSGSQISDSYSKAQPQFFRRTAGLIRFFLTYGRPLTLSKKILVFGGIAHLLCSAFRYLASEVILLLFGPNGLKFIKTFFVRPVP